VTIPLRTIVVDLVQRSKPGKTSTRFSSLTLKQVPPGATVTVSCARGCVRASLVVRHAYGTIPLKSLLRSSTRAGTKIRVVVSVSNMVSAVKTLTVRKNSRKPTIATRCIRPGATVDSRC